MNEVEQLRAEVERLRGVVNSYEQRELETLKIQLTSVWQEKEEWKREAHRLSMANIEYKDHMQAEIELVKSKLEAAKAITYGNSRVVTGIT